MGDVFQPEHIAVMFQLEHFVHLMRYASFGMYMSP